MPAGHPRDYCDKCQTISSDATAATGCLLCKTRAKNREYRNRSYRKKKQQKEQASTSEVPDGKEEQEANWDVDLEVMRADAIDIVNQVSSQLCRCEGCTAQLSLLKAELSNLFAAQPDLAAPSTGQNPEAPLTSLFYGHHVGVHRSEFDAPPANLSIDYVAVNVVGETPGVPNCMSDSGFLQTSAESGNQYGFATQLACGSFGTYVPSSNYYFVQEEANQSSQRTEPILTTLESVGANASTLATGITSATLSTIVFDPSAFTSLMISPDDAIHRDDLFPINYYLGKQLRIVELLHKYAEALRALEERGISIWHVGPANFRFELGQCTEPERYTGFQTKIVIVDESHQDHSCLAPEILKGHGASYKSASFSLFKMFYDNGKYHFVEEAVIIKGGKPEKAWRRVNPAVTSVLRGALRADPNRRLGLNAFTNLFWRTSEGIADDGLICVRPYDPQWSSDNVSWFN